MDYLKIFFYTIFLVLICFWMVAMASVISDIKKTSARRDMLHNSIVRFSNPVPRLDLQVQWQVSP